MSEKNDDLFSLNDSICVVAVYFSGAVNNWTLYCRMEEYCVGKNVKRSGRDLFQSTIPAFTG
jgi:hypothetical protein